MARVRRAPLSHRRSWWSVTSYMVEPIECYHSVFTFFRECLRGVLHQDWRRSTGLQRAMLIRAASIISACLGQGLEPSSQPGAGHQASSHPSTRPPPASFFVSPLHLALCGVPRKVERNGRRRLRLTSHRATRERWAYRPGPGGVATVLLDGCPYRLVYVRYPVLELNWTAVSSSIDSCRFFFPGSRERARRGAP